MIKIRIRNADHEIDVQFPISENKLYAKLAEIHAIEGKDAPQSALSELHSRVKRSLPLNSDALTTRLREPLKDMTSTRTLFERNCISGLPLATCRLAMRHTSSTS